MVQAILLDALNNEGYDQHDLLCPHCNSFLFSSKLDRYFELTIYECLKCSFLVSNWMFKGSSRIKITRNGLRFPIRKFNNDFVDKENNIIYRSKKKNEKYWELYEFSNINMGQ